jgi:hypothetical protein
MELSLAKLEDKVPQPPKARPSTAQTTKTAQIRELERTVPPLVRNFSAAFDATSIGLLAHPRETSVKIDAAPAIFRARPGMPGGPPSASHAEVRLFRV